MVRKRKSADAETNTPKKITKPSGYNLLAGKYFKSESMYFVFTETINLHTISLFLFLRWKGNYRYFYTRNKRSAELWKSLPKEEHKRYIDMAKECPPQSYNPWKEAKY